MNVKESVPQGRGRGMSGGGGHSGGGGLSAGNLSSGCDRDMEEDLDQLYAYFYLIIFIPGFLLNTVALWVLWRHIRKKGRTVIFMLNLALADLAHVLSLPLRIYYYFTLRWPFGRIVCLLCFYLKYLNMYAAICFLVCISVQRCVFLLKPFSARQWRKRYDLLISLTVWLVVGMACSPFVLVRGGPDDSPASTSSSSSSSFSSAYSSTQASTAGTLSYGSHSTGSNPEQGSIPSADHVCFKKLPTRMLSLPTVVGMIALVELFGFLLPFAAIGYSSARIANSLLGTRDRTPGDPLPARGHTLSTSSETEGTDIAVVDKGRALRMVLSCTVLFLVCFAPYHVNFLLYLMVSQDLVSHCGIRLVVRWFHPVSLCLSGLSCCLNPLLYYFLTAEFRRHLRSRVSSFTSTLSSPHHWRLRLQSSNETEKQSEESIALHKLSRGEAQS